MNSTLLAALEHLRGPAIRVKGRLSNALAPSLGADGVVVDPRQATPAWITSSLRAAGALGQERVTRVERQRFDAGAASLTRLKLRYTRTPAATAPLGVYLKVFSPLASDSTIAKVFASASGTREAAFYALAAQRDAARKDLPIVRCFDSRVASNGRAHLLLEDVSPTHDTSPWPLPPTGAQCRLAIEALARLHAFWWEDPEFGDGIEMYPIAEYARTLSDEIRTRFSEFATFLGDRLWPEAGDLYSHFLDKYYDFLMSGSERLATHSGITIVHGDAHWWNFLYPVRPGSDHAYIIDWEQWHVGLGMYDLATLLVANTDPEQYAMQRELLRHYHTTLVAQGVSDYSWSDCWSDYRRAALGVVALPVWHWVNGLPTRLWWAGLHRVVRNWWMLEQDDQYAILDPPSGTAELISKP